MKVYRTPAGMLLESDGRRRTWIGGDWDELFRCRDPLAWLREAEQKLPPAADGPPASAWLAPIGSQEVWAAGVTYYRSRSARMEEAAAAGGGDFYDRVYTAGRPELFFKASPHRVVGPGQKVQVRRDSRWNVPEPEWTLCVSSAGRIFGYTIGNDMSSREIEGENPLYLPQAKVYDGCCALGPCLLLADSPPPGSTEIVLDIRRGGASVFCGSTRLDQMKRTPQELVEYLLRQNSFPAGCFLLTGTGVVPPPDFTLFSGDLIRITMEPIGTLENTVA